MVSEKFIQSKLEKLKTLDVSRDLIVIELQYYFGLYDVITSECFDNLEVPTGVYKEFCDTYRELSSKHSQIISKRLDNDYKICENILKSINNK